jgi:hypothetical protein
VTKYEDLAVKLEESYLFRGKDELFYEHVNLGRMSIAVLEDYLFYIPQRFKRGVDFKLELQTFYHFYFEAIHLLETHIFELFFVAQSLQYHSQVDILFFYFCCKEDTN